MLSSTQRLGNFAMQNSEEGERGQETQGEGEESRQRGGRGRERAYCVQWFSFFCQVTVKFVPPMSITLGGWGGLPPHGPVVKKQSAVAKKRLLKLKKWKILQN